MLNPPITCKEQHPWTDEEGRYDKFLCKRDFNECKHNCDQHERIFECNSNNVNITKKA